MKQIANELRRIIYLPWIPVTLAAVLSFLIFYFCKLYSGQDGQSSLLFLLSDRKYFGILYALLALFIFALDVESGAVDAHIMAGQSIASVVLRKTLIYFSVVIILSGIYSAVCIHVCDIAFAGAWKTLLIRLLLDIGIAAIFIPLQFIFRTLQPAMIINSVAAVVFIIASAPKYEMWYAVIGGSAVPAIKFAAAAAAIIVMPLLAVLCGTKGEWK